MKQLVATIIFVTSSLLLASCKPAVEAPAVKLDRYDDEPLRAGMGRIHGLVEPQLSAAHAGKPTPAQYRKLATQVETEVGGIVTNCKLEPESDAMLHLVIADLGAGTDAMAGRDVKTRPVLGLVKVAQAVNQYGSHFDHPGFKPIRNVN